MLLLLLYASFTLSLAYTKSYTRNYELYNYPRIPEYRSWNNNLRYNGWNNFGLQSQNNWDHIDPNTQFHSSLGHQTGNWDAHLGQQYQREWKDLEQNNKELEKQTGYWFMYPRQHTRSDWGEQDDLERNKEEKKNIYPGQQAQSDWDEQTDLGQQNNKELGQQTGIWFIYPGLHTESDRTKPEDLEQNNKELEKQAENWDLHPGQKTQRDCGEWGNLEQTNNKEKKQIGNWKVNSGQQTQSDWNEGDTLGQNNKELEEQVGNWKEHSEQETQSAKEQTDNWKVHLVEQARSDWDKQTSLEQQNNKDWRQETGTWNMHPGQQTQSNWGEQDILENNKTEKQTGEWKVHSGQQTQRDLDELEVLVQNNTDIDQQIENCSTLIGQNESDGMSDLGQISQNNLELQDKNFESPTGNFDTGLGQQSQNNWDELEQLENKFYVHQEYQSQSNQNNELQNDTSLGQHTGNFDKNWNNLEQTQDSLKSLWDKIDRLDRQTKNLTEENNTTPLRPLEVTESNQDKIITEPDYNINKNAGRGDIGDEDLYENLERIDQSQDNIQNSNKDVQEEELSKQYEKYLMTDSMSNIHSTSSAPKVIRDEEKIVRKIEPNSNHYAALPQPEVKVKSGFWGDLGNRLSGAKDKVASWFQRN